jgi:hypothetical protein
MLFSAERQLVSSLPCGSLEDVLDRKMCQGHFTTNLTSFPFILLLIFTLFMATQIYNVIAPLYQTYSCSVLMDHNMNTNR